MNSSVKQAAPPFFLKVIVGKGADGQSFRFAKTFRIGRAEECEVCLQNDYVSRNHAEGFFENGKWWIRDLNSSNGVFVAGQRIASVPIDRTMTIRLGIEGPELTLGVEHAAEPEKRPAQTGGSETMVARYVDHYFGKSAANSSAGEHTAYVRKAFAQVQIQQQQKYSKIIALLIIATLGIGSYAVYLHLQVSRQKAMAQNLFYTMKSLDVDIANLEKVVLASDSEQGREVIRKYENQRREMEKDYDRFLTTLHVYNPKLTEQQRLVMRIARIFGECELDMPPDFESEINKYIKYWQSSGRLATAIRTAKENGYTDVISKELLAEGLPPQFFYLALQESNFDPYISGPMTRKGIAKGMWQFVPETAIKYGLRLGPLADLRRPDPGDERDQYSKATKAAATYLNDLYSTDAQASGLLVMACYNWGEDQVLPLVRSLPPNPRERNFWQLLSHHRDKIPQETYDYVFYIASAAVIGENPRLFGFDFDNPLAGLNN